MNLDKIIREEIQKLKLNEAAGKTMPDTFFDQVVQKLGGQPTEEKRKFFRAWKRAEGTAAKFNPLATTLKLKDAYGGSSDMEGSVNKGRPVQDYPTIDAGIDATYWTLKNTYGGKAYQNLVNGLKSDDVTAEELANQTAELATWSKTSGKYVADQLPYVADQVTTSSADNTTTNNLDISKEIPAKAELDIDSEDGALSSEDNKLIDKIQTILDFAGFVPVIGDAADLVNAVIYGIRGMWLSAVLSLIAVIPGVGSAIAVPAKVLFRRIKSVIKPDILTKALKNPTTEKWTEVISAAAAGKMDYDGVLRALGKYADTGARSVDDMAKTLGSPKFAMHANELSALFRAIGEGASKSVDDVAKLAKQADIPVDVFTKLYKTMDPLELAKLISNRKIGFIKRVINVANPLKAKSINLKTLEYTRRISDDFATKIITDPKVFGSMLNQVKRMSPSRSITVSKDVLKLLDSATLRQLGRNATPNQLASAANRAVEKFSRLPNTSAHAIVGQRLTDKLLNNPASSKLVKGLEATYMSRQFSNTKGVLADLVSRSSVKDFLFNSNQWKSGMRGINVNAYKLFGKTYTIGYYLTETNNVVLTTVGKILQSIAQATYDITNLSSLPNSDTDDNIQRQIQNAQDALSDSQSKLEPAFNAAIDEFTSGNLSESDAILLNAVLSSYE